MLYATNQLKPKLAFTGSTAATASYTQVSAALAAPAAGMWVQNKTNKILKFALGAAASEVDVPFYVQPNVEGVFVAYPFPKGARLSVKAVDADVSTGAYVINLLG